MTILFVHARTGVHNSVSPNSSRSVCSALGARRRVFGAGAPRALQARRRSLVIPRGQQSSAEGSPSQQQDDFARLICTVDSKWNPHVFVMEVCQSLVEMNGRHGHL